MAFFTHYFYLRPFDHDPYFIARHILLLSRVNKVDFLNITYYCCPEHLKACRGHKDKNNHYFCDRCLSFSHLAISKDVELHLQRFLTMNIASFDMNLRVYFVLFRSTRVAPGLARCERVDPAVV